MKLNKIFIFTAEPFPIGLAATNRIISYAKGFQKNGKKVEVVIFRKTENYAKRLNHNSRGTYSGIPYRYLSANTYKSANKLMRQLERMAMLISLKFFSLFNLNKNSLVIYYAPYTNAAIILRLSSWIKRALLFKEESEHPSVYIRGKSSSLRSYIFQKWHYKLFDGYLLMTKNLINYFTEKYPSKPYAHIPMTVELDRFQNKKAKTSQESKTIIYTGVISNEKDGTDILLEAFAEIVRKYPEYKLSIYGEASKPAEKEQFQQLAKKLNIISKVHFHGRVGRKVIEENILKASILVLPRPDSIQAQNGFPTKLGEYLATGNPVIATSVGEIPYYLEDNKSVFMATPGDKKSLVTNFLKIIEDYPNALKVGEKGRKVAEENFNSNIQSQKVIEFVENNF